MRNRDQRLRFGGDPFGERELFSQPGRAKSGQPRGINQQLANSFIAATNYRPANQLNPFSKRYLSGRTVYRIVLFLFEVLQSFHTENNRRDWLRLIKGKTPRDRAIWGEDPMVRKSFPFIVP